MSSNTILDTVGSTLYKLSFQISPIFFSGGIAQNFGGYLPIVFLTEAASFVNGLLNGQGLPSLDQFFAHFSPIPGGRLNSYAVATYPFANQTVAANAIIAEPLHLSMKMSIPVNQPGGHVSKLATMYALKKAIDQHAMLGGTYMILTPSYFYTNGILENLTDISGADFPIPQNTWQWDFTFPLVTMQQATGALNTLNSTLQNQGVTNGSLNAGATSGNVPLSGQVGSGVTTNQNPIAAGASSYLGLVTGGLSTSVFGS